MDSGDKTHFLILARQSVFHQLSWPTLGYWATYVAVVIALKYPEHKLSHMVSQVLPSYLLPVLSKPFGTQKS